MSAEHFPKPGTKADTRMLLEEEKHIEETSSEGTEADEEEQKSVVLQRTKISDSVRPARGHAADNSAQSS